MKAYEYACHDCKVIWDKEFKWGHPAETMKCPDCGVKCDQNWLGRKAPAVHFKGAGWTGQNLATGKNKIGGSDEVNKMLQQQSKDRMDGGWKHYAKYTPPEKLTDNARKLSEKELDERLKLSKKVTQTNYDKAGMSPYKKKRPSNT